jgi:hypothetical protein
MWKLELGSGKARTQIGRWGWGGGAAGLQPNPKLNVKNHRFCRHDGVKRFTWFGLQPKSATESANDWNIIILKNKMKN